MAEQKYKNVPLDPETYRMVKVLAQAKGFGERGQGAVVRSLVRAEYEKLDSVKLPASANETQAQA
jgi:hypothetical protein